MTEPATVPAAAIIEPIHMLPAKHFRRPHAAAYVRETYAMPCSTQWLAKLATVGGGPTYRKAGRTPIYTQVDLDDWAKSRISKPVRSSSEYRASREAA